MEGSVCRHSKNNFKDLKAFILFLLMQLAYTAQEVFTGREWLHNHAVIVSKGLIEKVIPISELPGNIERKDFPHNILVPAFIDVQVYGAAKKLLSVYPQRDTLQLMSEQFLKEGTVLFQPTIATNTTEVFKKSIDAVRDYWNNGGKGVHGLHLEGPWLNADKSGAHVKEWIHSPSISEVQELLQYGKEVITMITVAPEVCSDEVLDLMRSYNVIVSAGHSNASYAEATNGFDKGIATVTHLFNAMSPLHHREPGLVGATLHHTKVRSSIIPDGHHVDYAAIAVAKKIMAERLFAITDAVTETITGPYQHQLAGDKYESNGILSGSAITMYRAFYNLVSGVKLHLDEALRMCSLYPAEVLNVDNQYGKIAPLYTGQFVVLNKQLKLVEVIT